MTTLDFLNKVIENAKKEESILAESAIISAASIQMKILLARMKYLNERIRIIQDS